MQAEIAKALAEMAGKMAQVDDGATHLTCGEADSIATVLAMAGHIDEAAAFLECHSYGDDEGDMHHELQGAAATATGYAMALI